MTIYGTALLSLCLIAGMAAGRLLGLALGVDADIGGVGLAMLLLIWGGDWLHRTGQMKAPTESGIVFWSSIYIPIVVAMAASQNVRAALSGGPAALLAGTAAVAAGFALTGLLTKLGRDKPGDP